MATRGTFTVIGLDRRGNVLVAPDANALEVLARAKRQLHHLEVREISKVPRTRKKATVAPALRLVRGDDQ